MLVDPSNSRDTLVTSQEHMTNQQENVHRFLEDLIRTQGLSLSIAPPPTASFGNMGASAATQRADVASAIASARVNAAVAENIMQYGRSHDLWPSERNYVGGSLGRQTQIIPGLDSVRASMVRNRAAVALPSHPLTEFTVAGHWNLLSSVQEPRLVLSRTVDGNQVPVRYPPAGGIVPVSVARLQQLPLTVAHPISSPAMITLNQLTPSEIESQQRALHSSILHQLAHIPLSTQQQRLLFPHMTASACLPSREYAAAATSPLSSTRQNTHDGRSEFHNEDDEEEEEEGDPDGDGNTSEEHSEQLSVVANAPSSSPGTYFRAKKRRKYRHESFPEKLYRMLDETAQLKKDDIVSFTKSGKAFEIHRQDAFLNEIIPKFFRHKSISSFRRQLSMYGFRRVKDGSEMGAYFHELFIRGKPELCKQMKRVAELELVVSSASAGAADAAEGSAVGAATEARETHNNKIDTPHKKRDRGFPA